MNLSLAHSFCLTLYFRCSHSLPDIRPVLFKPCARRELLIVAQMPPSLLFDNTPALWAAGDVTEAIAVLHVAIRLEPHAQALP